MHVSTTMLERSHDRRLDLLAQPVSAEPRAARVYFDADKLL